MPNLRLTKKEIEAIIDTTREYDQEADIFLYGSRIDSEAKGGDIDLFIVSELISFKEKLAILARIKQLIGEQKIDLTILKKDKLMHDIFFQNVPKIEL